MQQQENTLPQLIKKIATTTPSFSSTSTSLPLNPKPIQNPDDFLAAPQTIYAVADSMVPLIKNTNIKQLIGLEIGVSIPLTTTISQISQIPFLMVRSFQKKYGEQKLIEGVDNKTDETGIILDFLSNDTTLLEKALTVTQSQGIKLKKIFVYKIESQASQKKLEALGYQIIEPSTKRSPLAEIHPNTQKTQIQALPTPKIPKPSEIDEAIKKLKEEVTIDLYKYKIFILETRQQTWGDIIPTYMDMRKLVSFPHILEKIIRLYYLTILQHNAANANELLAIVPLGALPLGSILSIHLDKPLIYPLRSTNTQQVVGSVAGKYQPGQTTLLIEDVIYTGTSTKNTRAFLKQQGLKVTTAIGFLDTERYSIRTLNDGDDHCKLFCVIKTSEILNTLETKINLTDAEKAAINAEKTLIAKHAIKTQLIDITQPTPANLERIKALHKQYPKKKKFHKNRLYRLSDGTYIKLSNSLVTFNYPDKVEYCVISTGASSIAGKGFWSNVKRCTLIYTIEKTSENVHPEPKNTVVKIEGFDEKQTTKQEWEDKVTNEAKITAILHQGASPIQIRKRKSYFYREYIDGIPLNEYLKKYSTTFRQLLNIYLNIAEQIHYFHQKKCIHRDTKLNNILINPLSGSIKIIDLGTAKTMDTQADLTDTKGWCTPLYSPPELRNKKGTNAKADIYFLGALIALTLGAKGEASLQEEFKFDGIFENLKINSTTRQAIRNLLEKMLSPNSSNRPNIAEVIENLQTIIKNCPLQDLQTNYTNLPNVINYIEEKILHLNKLAFQNSEAPKNLAMAGTSYTSSSSTN
jgi:orotate phosphoribosyltransferase/serine/threonine protein kinase